MPPRLNPPKNKPREPASILQKATVAAGALRDVSSSSQVPFLHAISGVSFAIFGIVRSFKVQKQEYVQLVEQIHELLWVVIDLCVGSQTTVLIPPSILHTVGNLAQTLQKIHSFLERQQAMGTLKRFLRTGNTQQLEQYKAELRDSLAGFSLHSSMAATVGLAKAQIDEEARHGELLALVAALSGSTASGFSASTGSHSVFTDSSNSLLSLLPATPKIFHGRDGELQQIVAILLQESPRVAILGSGGIGKTSLATAALHHPKIAQAFQQRYFVACDAAATHSDLLHIVASNLQLEPTQNLIVRSLASGPPTLLVLDNLETAWEPLASRARVEEFLSLLTDIPHLGLLITMRGVERPGKVRWTRPFLAPLKPLSYEAARQTFLDISDERESNSDIDELLRFTDNLPLAVSLIANIVSYEGSETVLQRWKEERTDLLSEGRDKRSNLDISISLSLSSPRMAAFPGAQDLLGALTLLPDGISEFELMQCGLPIQDIENCKVALIRTSLAYVDRDGRIKTLVPIREYIQGVHPPTPKLVRPLRDQLYELLMLWKTFRQVSTPESIPRISANLANLQSVVVWGLKYDDEDVSSTIRRILTLDSFMRAIGRGIPTLREYIPGLLERCRDHQVHGEYLLALFDSQHYFESNELPGDLETKAIREFQLANDNIGEVQLYNVLSTYHLFHKDDSDTAEMARQSVDALRGATGGARELPAGPKIRSGSA
ncbi:P-loop containing nucleoside triphosphate hydrolase protein [Mycena latifolia]|nr:P-loop containing nucleoside triphosphate hydrolase protein [Mycena latifolia]